MELSFIEISRLTPKLLTAAFPGVKEVIENFQKTDGFQIYHCYRTVGEHKLLLVIKGDVDLLVDAIYTTVGGDVSVTCTPLRCYENFAKHLGTEKNVYAEVSPGFAEPKTIFYSKVTVDHPGKTTDEFYHIWEEHAQWALTERIRGKLDFRPYKVVGRREIVVFFNVESGDAIDDAIPKLLLVQRIGNDIDFNFKLVKPLV